MPKVKIYDSETFPDLFSEKQVRVFQLPDFKVCIAKHNDQYFAFEYLCPHQKHPMAKARITSFGDVVCPLHDFRYSLSDGTEANSRCRALNNYKLHVNAEAVYLEF